MSIKIPLLRLESVLPSSPSHVTRFCDFAVPADSSCLVTTPLVPDADKQRGCSANHGSIGDSWPIAFSGCPRGTRVGCETKRARGTPSLTTQLRLALEPECLKKNSPPLERIPAMERIRSRHSSCLCFQMFGVEAHSFLPNNQRDGCNLPRQSQ